MVGWQGRYQYRVPTPKKAGALGYHRNTTILLIRAAVPCKGGMSAKKRSPRDATAPEPIETRPLTVAVPAKALQLAKLRASVEGTTLSAVVSVCVVDYAAGFKETVRKLGLGD